MKKAGLTILCAALLAGLFLACGGGGGQAPAQTTMEFIISNGTEIQSVDPSQIQGVPEHRVNIALFEGLIGYDPHTAAAVPGVAESWTYNEDHTVITFKIRQGITWSDGEPITAQTFVDSWLHHLDPQTASHYAYMPGMVIKGANEYNTGVGPREGVAIRAADPQTFEVTLVGPVPYALDMMSHYAFNPLPMHAIQAHGDNWTQAANFVGNGPFVLQEWLPNNRLVVVPNERYWNRANIHLTKLTYLPIEDTNTAYQAFKNGELDWSVNVPLAIMDQLKLDKDYHVGPQLGSYFYYFNMQHPILSDVRIRKALSLAFNRQELIDNVVKGGQIPAFSLSPPMLNYEPTPGIGEDIALAKQLLAEAGYPNGEGLPTFTIIYNTLDAHRVIAEYLQETWKNNLGVNVTLQNMEWATFLEERKTSRMELGRAGWIADYQDPQNFLDLFITGGGNNDGKYSNPEFDELIRQASGMAAGPERDAILRQAEDILLIEDHALIPIYIYVTQNIINLDKWDGWYDNPMNVHTWTGIKLKEQAN